MMMDNIIKFRVLKDRVFISAVLVSIVWHIFWMLAIKVVVVPTKTEPIRFSKVSFLGPILGRSVPELRIEPKKQTFLEKRYIRKIEEMLFDRYELDIKYIDTKGELLSDKKLSYQIKDAISGSKIEPIYDLE